MYKVESIYPVNDNGEEVIPQAIGVKIINSNTKDLVGASFKSNRYLYDNTKTDADVFLARTTSDALTISFGKANFFKLFTDKQPLTIEFNGNELVQNKNWVFINNTVSISEIDN